MASPVLASPDQHSRRWSLPTIFRWQDNTTGDDVEYEVSDMFSAELPPSPVNSIHPPPPVKPALSTTPTSAFDLSPSVSNSTATTKSFADHSRPANSSLDSLRYLPGYPTAPSSPITVTTNGSDSWTTFPSTAITTSTTASIPSTTPIAPPPSRRQLVVQSHDFSAQQQQLQKTLLSFPVPTVTMTTTTVPSATAMPIFVPLTQRPDHPLGGVKSPQPSAGVLAADSPIGADRVADSFLLGSSAPELNADLSISSQVKPPAHVAIPVGTATTTTDRVLHPAPQATAASPPLPRRASNLSSSGRVSTTSTHISIPAPSHSARRHHPRDHSLDPTWSIISDKPNLNLTNQGSPDGPTSRYVPITTTRPAARPNDPTRRQWAIYLGLIALVIILTVCIWPIVNAVAGLIVLPILLIFILVVIIVWYHRKHMGALSAANIMASETGAAGAAMHRPAGAPPGRN
ncbi:hypothetical protein IWQ60_001404 [Tieghemiomyces parasiticus]|uniref:Uncharacterized protein n=1 Tax=Tieghemiomyces parasiticus TaxID=78921 RepID=A0A9W8DYC8_9FUNG|nr:hypothetical protein IWQ60_001404 [Tieghemiomyces parasiticus]